MVFLASLRLMAIDVNIYDKGIEIPTRVKFKVREKTKLSAVWLIKSVNDVEEEIFKSSKANSSNPLKVWLAKDPLNKEVTVSKMFPWKLRFWRLEIKYPIISLDDKFTLASPWIDSAWVNKSWIWEDEELIKLYKNNKINK